MKKILYALVIIAVWYSGFTVISAQNDAPAKNPILQKDQEQNMNEMIRLLDKLQNDEVLEEDFSLPKNDTLKTQMPDDPMAIFSKPKEPSQPANTLIAPALDSQPGDKFSGDEAAKLDEIEKNVDAMLKALEELEISGSLAPDTIEPFTPPADRLSPNKNTLAGKSIEKTDEVVRLDLDGPDRHFQNGLVYWQSENLDRAIIEFQAVIRLAPENAHAYWNLGLLHDKLNRGAEAIANLKKAEGLYSKYNYPAFAEDARKRLNQFSGKYKPSLR